MHGCVQAIMEVLAHAAQNRPYLGLYWTMWKLLQSCANLAGVGPLQ
jgi:hypothetical protein